MQLPPNKLNLPFLISGLLLIFLVGFIGLNFTWVQNTLSKDNWRRILFQTRILNQNVVNISFDSGRMNLKFDLTDSEREDALDFAANLGISEQFLNGFSLELDSATLSKLQQSVPKSLAVNFEGKNLTLFSDLPKGLATGIAAEEYVYATDSAKLTVRQNSAGKIEIEINQPATVLAHAILENKYYLSEETKPLVMQILERIATMNITSEKNFFNAEVKLK